MRAKPEVAFRDVMHCPPPQVVMEERQRDRTLAKSHWGC